MATKRRVTYAGNGMAIEIYNETYRAPFLFLQMDKKSLWKKDEDLKWFTDRGAEWNDHANGFVLYSNSEQRVIICCDKKDYPVLAHECFHACVFMAEWRGLSGYLQDGGEPIAYLLEWLMRKVLEIGNKPCK